MTNAEKLTLAKHACHIRMGVIEGTHSAKCCLTSTSWI